MFCTRCGSQVTQQSKFCPSCGLDLSSVTPLATGQMPADQTDSDIVKDALKGEYEIVEELGRGGMAIVFRAREKQLDRDVAVKVLPFSLAFDAEFVERFQREARTAAQLEHPNIIPIYRVGRTGRVIYFVMKLLRGSALSDVIAQRGALPVAEIKRMLMETAGALGYAHGHGIVHRDIKPDNIMFDESGHAVVTDFGIAKAGSGTRLTGTGMAIGTPHYMSPEQARAQKLDGRSDIYSLGVVAYQCLAGVVPFDGEDAFSIGYKHITDPLPRPELATGEHRHLFEIIWRMMAKAPEERFQTADELVAALEGRSTAAAIAAQATVALDAAETAELSQSTLGRRPANRPSTPTTPMPRAMPRPEPAGAKRGGGVLVGMFLMLILIGGSGGGAYYYYVVLRNAPPAFLAGILPATAPQTTAAAGAPAANPAAAESTARDSVAPDSTAAVAGSQARPPAADLPNTGTLTLVNLPPRGRVTVDGEIKDGNPLTLDAGSRRIEVTAPGYGRFAATVAIRRGGDTTLTVQLQRPSAGPAGVTSAGAETKADVCAVPGPSYNKGDACWDTPPRALVAPLVPLNDRVQGMPPPAIMWVQVSEDGRPTSLQMVRGSGDDQFDALARGFAMSITYNPAQKDGRPIEGWVQMRLLPKPR
jgi:Protein kinase domain/Gram-negative bacterial TonB protein C-terminal/zinc-ribbon domain